MGFVSDQASGHGMPIHVDVVDGALRVSGGIEDPFGFAPMMFLDDTEDGELDHLTLPGFGAVALTNLPGLDVRGVLPNSQLLMTPVGRPDQGASNDDPRWLWYWASDAGVVQAPNDETFELVSEFGQMRVAQGRAPQPASLKFGEPLEDELGEHVHYLRYLLDDDPVAAVGAYGIFVQITSPNYQPSEPLLLMFSNRTGGAALLEAAEEMNRAATIAGDFNRDERLTSFDLERVAEATRVAEPHRRFDLNGDERVDGADVAFWVHSLKKTWVGDANLDGRFDSTDLIQVFQVGSYEKEMVADWASGDWNGDQRFGSTDLIVAFQDGGYEAGIRPAAVVVPEPKMGLFAYWMAMVAWMLPRVLGGRF